MEQKQIIEDNKVIKFLKILKQLIYKKNFNGIYIKKGNISNVFFLFFFHK